MSKRNPLQAALDRVERPRPEPVAPEAAPEPHERASSSLRKPSREGTVLIGGHFPPAVKQRLRMLAAEENTTSQALLEEALDLLFIKKGKQAIR